MAMSKWSVTAPAPPIVKVTAPACTAVSEVNTGLQTAVESGTTDEMARPMFCNWVLIATNNWCPVNLMD